jgi:hypothetical protein
MLAKVCSAAVNGIDAYPVEIEVNAGYGDTLLIMLPGILPTELAGKGSGAPLVWTSVPRKRANANSYEQHTEIASDPNRYCDGTKQNC